MSAAVSFLFAGLCSVVQEQRKTHYSELCIYYLLHIFMIHLVAHLRIIGHCPVGQAPTALQYEAFWKGVLFSFSLSTEARVCEKNKTSFSASCCWAGPFLFPKLNSDVTFD